MSQRLADLPVNTLLGMRRGIEKESLRVLPNGQMAMTPHPQALGSALTHPNITTDFSESQLELITSAHTGVQACLDELTHVHQYTYRALRDAGEDMLWVSSMPCGLPHDDDIPPGQYGSSNIAQAKHVYRLGLGHRYGRRMQTISGIHYNWSLPGVSSEQYFALIRNFRRRAFLLLYLFGASPSVCSTFVEGRAHALEPLARSTHYMPHGTSLRMGSLGYQSEAQASLAVSYNSLEGYAASLHDALTRPWPAYEAMGIQAADGSYLQLATSLLQIENEFYGTIRPKRTIFQGERPLHALRERGVEYVEVRLMDLDPFEPVGISASTMRFLDVFLLHALLSDSPKDSPQEIVELARNQHLTAARGREPGLKLWRDGHDISLRDWGLELVQDFAPVAQALDAANATTDYTAALQAALVSLAEPERLPSARVLKAMAERHDNSFVGFVRERSVETQAVLLGQAWSGEQQTRFAAMANQSLQDQAQIEAADTLPFEIFRQEYVSPKRLG